jgi:ssDNA-binding Zn-finger/Zn-ribbon topoisomerase 1
MTIDEIKARCEAKKDGLLPCPFCGGEARVCVQKDWWWIACENYSGIRSCQINPLTEKFISKKKAIEAWNKRALIPFLIAEIEKRDRAIKYLKKEAKEGILSAIPYPKDYFENIVKAEITLILGEKI